MDVTYGWKVKGGGDEMATEASFCTTAVVEDEKLKSSPFSVKENGTSKDEIVLETDL